MNSTQVTGRLTEDPELRLLPSGETACKIRLAVEGMARARETGYINVTSYGSSGQAAAAVLSKGWLVAVDGRIEYRQWETDEGSKRHDYGLVGHIEFLAAPHGEQDMPGDDSGGDGVPDGDAAALHPAAA